MKYLSWKIILIFFIMLSFAACSTGRRYPYKKKRKKNCNCPRWSENLIDKERTYFYG